jgi:parallel beta-helix repeat protein
MLNRLKNALWLIVGAVVAVWAVTSLVGLVRAGPMEPWAPPGSTMKTLDAVEPRTAIWQPESPSGFPIIIGEPGSYYLTQNITGVSGENGIEITSDDVTLDLNGFALIGQPGTGSGVGAGLHDNISIDDGTIQSWGGSGVVLTEMQHAELKNLRVLGNAGYGISVSTNVVVSDCIVANNGFGGLYVLGAATVTGCAAYQNGGAGIVVGLGSVVTDSVSTGNQGDGIVAYHAVVEACVAKGNVSNGIVAGEADIVTGNTAISNGGAGIYVPSTGTGVRVEANNVSYNARGIDVDYTGNIIVKNSASDNTTDYDIAAGNAYGQIVDMTAGGAITADPWANFRY